MRFFRYRYQNKKNSIPEIKLNRIYSDLSINLSGELSENLDVLHRLFINTSDLVVRQFKSKQNGSRNALVYLEGLADKNLINDHILRPLMFDKSLNSSLESVVTIGSIKYINSWREIEKTILHGGSVLFIDDLTKAAVFNTQGWPQRAIEDPQLEASLKGAHQGFTETGSQNIAMIRRFIANRELKIKEYTVGKRSESKVSILYLADVAHPEILKELEDRIKHLDVDCILNTGELAEYIEDNPYSPFPQFLMTERPDSAASQLLQGRLCVIVDRSSSALIAPTAMISFLQSVDDYSTRWIVASFIRILRFLAFLIAIFLPALYISIISFNFQIIPMDLLLSIGESRERVPFSPIIEALLMEITLELLREAGIRLPSPIGQTVGIVGGIVIGQAAVEAGIVSNIMVIVVSFTAIASFSIPNYDMASSIRLIRFPMMLIAWMFGIVGIMVGWMLLIGHLLSLKSLGTPYFSPLAPVRFSDWKDTFIRVPLWKMTTRPKSTRAIQSKRMGSNRPLEDDK
ncbi:spore germination protein [Bacillus sp. 7884-1]|uniref:spore germination protein n=1 Tax=Bacillus sp. 7884-1 TaxID=2021693 RepID=UPI000BA62D27|nr:spore germination protein [Bacillus sp. 7884-1]PAE39395.1 spore germination protein [Bacillus sp. 7884-1]